MKLIWYTVLIRAIPEALGLILLTLAIAKEERDSKSILLVSVTWGIVAFILRMLPLKFGIHMLLIVVIETIIMNVILKIKLQKAFLGILVSLAVLAFTEAATFKIIESILRLNPEEVFSTTTGTLLSGIPSVLMLYIIAFIINKTTNTRRLKEAGNYVDK